MKKSFPYFLITILISLLSTYSVSGQNKLKYDVQKLIKLNNESELQEIVLPVKDSVNAITIAVYSHIQNGDITIELYEPNGEKHGYFSIGCQAAPSDNRIKNPGKSVYYTNPDKATGNLSRTIKNPGKGDWKIKIIPKDATGTVNIDFALKDLGHSYINLK